MWSYNDEASEVYGYPILPISSELKIQIRNLEDEFQGSLDWDYPSDLSPWTKEQWTNFKEEATEVYNRLCKELGSGYEIIDELYTCIHN